MQLNVTELHVLEGCTAAFSYADLPLKADIAASTTHVQTIFELHENCDRTSLHDVLRNMQDGTALPDPFAVPDGMPPNEMQMFLYPGGPEQFSLLKLFRFKRRVQRSRVTSLFTGSARYVDQQQLNSSRLTPLILQHMLTNMGGDAIVNRELVAVDKETKKQHRSDAQIDAGYDFINTKGPVCTAQNQHMIWADKQTRNEASPIYGWPASQVLTAVSNIRAAVGLAKRITSYPLTLKDLSNWTLLNVVQAVIPNARQNATMFVGPSGMGKTPLVNAMSLALSAQEIESIYDEDGAPPMPSFKTSSHLDFVRSEPGERHVPFVLDDADFPSQKSDALKSFCDSSGEDVSASRVGTPPVSNSINRGSYARTYLIAARNRR
eukprot:2691856-Amphidinium_carterae.1